MKLEINAPHDASSDTSHDRLSVLGDAHRTLIALADGVGPNDHAQTAASRTVDELARCFRCGALPDNARDWEMILEAIDHIVLNDPQAGETNALVMRVEQDVVVGASVGDSLAYVVHPDGESSRLTPSRRLGARMGTGFAAPVGFGPVKLEGRLITRRAPSVRYGYSAVATA